MEINIYVFAAICTALAALALLSIILPLWRDKAGQAAVDTDIDIYRDQLAEVERDLARGVLDEVEAERTRTEISRRLLNADATGRDALKDAPKGLSRAMAVVLGLGLMAGAGGFYFTHGAPGYGDVSRAERVALSDERRATRPGQLEAEEATPPSPNLMEEFDDQTRDLIETRRLTAFENPEDVAAWDILSRTEAAIGAYTNATRAQERVIALKGEAATPADIEALLDLMVAATAGYVSPEAEAVARRQLELAPDNAAAQYYLGLMYAQNDRPDLAFPIWREVVEETPRDTLHWNFAAGQIGDVAFMLGVDYALPDERGPTNDQMAAAQDMSEEDRAAMIQGMVQQLAERLANEGGPPQDWARLVTALGVLGEDEKARQVVAEAEIVFGGDVQAVGIIRAAAQEAGVLE